MRLVPLLLLLVLAMPLVAQTPDPASFYPLGVGDLREYSIRENQGPDTFRREIVVGDTMVAGQNYRLVVTTDYNAYRVPSERSRWAVRFDSLGAIAVRGRGGGETPIVPCRLDLWWPDPECPYGIEARTDGHVYLNDTMVVTTTKSFYGPDFGEQRYAAGLGLVRHAGRGMRLDFALIGGAVYGTPEPTLPPLGAPDPTPPASYFPLSVGDEWHYRDPDPAATHPLIHRRVTGTELIDDAVYARVETRRSTLYGTDTFLGVQRVRFDEQTARVIERRPTGDDVGVLYCPLDVPFPTADLVPSCAYRYSQGGRVVAGGLAEPVAVGDTAFTRPSKTFRARSGEGRERVVAGIGMIEWEGAVLYHAVVGSVEYGTPYVPPPPPVASDFWPLQVGNGWAYQTTEFGYPTHRSTIRVVADTLLDGRSYAALQQCYRYGDDTWTCYPRYVRTDDAAGAILEWAGAGEPEHVVMCGLNTPPNSTVTCGPLEGMVLYVHPAPNAVAVASQSVAVGEIRGLDGPVDPGVAGWAAGFGRLETPVWQGWSSITYARIGDRTYGVFPISADETPPTAPSAEFRVAAYPSPTDGPVTLAVVGAASPAEVEVFDALGRRVWRGSVAGEATVDARGWAPGVYLLRATAPDGATTVSRFVRR